MYQLVIYFYFYLCSDYFILTDKIHNERVMECIVRDVMSPLGVFESFRY